MKNPDFHADDYALSVATSNDLLELMKKGRLDSISVVANTSCYEQCMKLLKDNIRELPFLPSMSVHLNLVEGRQLSNGDESLPLLEYTWGRLFFLSLIRKDYKMHLKFIREQMAFQIKRAQKDINECIDIARSYGIQTFQEGLRIDSHQHAHAIPLMWEAFLLALNDTGYSLEYVRIPKEPLMPYLKCVSLYATYRPVNIVKNVLLNILSVRLDKYCKMNGMRPMYIWGLIMSGKMDIDRMKKLMPSMMSYAKKHNRSLELVFHPGTMLSGENEDEVAKDAFCDFYNNSSARNIEKQTVLNL